MTEGRDIIAPVLSHFDLTGDDLLGAGAEAWVFAISNTQVLRINKEGTDAAAVERRADLLRTFIPNTPDLPYAIPLVQHVDCMNGIYFTIENRIPGMSVSAALMRVRGCTRARLVTAYLNAALYLAKLVPENRPFGEIAADEPINTDTFKDYLWQRGQKSLKTGDLKYDLRHILDQIEEPPAKGLVHLDYYPANVMCNGDQITGVLDFGPTAIVGDARFNAVIAAASLPDDPSDASTQADRGQAREWLQTHAPDVDQAAITRWLAAYWSFCSKSDDPGLFAWCEATLRRD